MRSNSTLTMGRWQFDAEIRGAVLKLAYTMRCVRRS